MWLLQVIRIIVLMKAPAPWCGPCQTHGQAAAMPTVIPHRQPSERVHQ